ncbi:MAG: 4Fe-4S dicluster domain-containing protein, partial [Acidobacteriota bacterium]|nr:4Fe-4S dicluster domain-containing protein [Acidobacteriota bacterium]
CVSDCLAMEVDPGFIGPAALAKAYRFVGDPRDDKRHERLNDLAQDPQGIFDCTHCFKCVQACPKEVNPMGQIMRLRRVATSDEGIVDDNNGQRHEQAFTSLVRGYGLLHEAELLPRSYGGDSWFGKFQPAAGRELLSSLRVILTAVLRGKVSPVRALLGHRIPRTDLDAVRAIYDHVEGRGSKHRGAAHERRYELNLYVSGLDEDGGSATPDAPSGAARSKDAEGTGTVGEEEAT